MSETCWINLKRWIEVFDEKIEESIGCATPINSLLGEEVALAAFQDYAIRSGWDVRELQGVVSQGKKKGKRLDAWLQVKRTDSSELWQVEVKNWSAHSTDGVRVSHSTDLIRYKTDRWAKEWQNGLKKPQTQKVLTRMLNRNLTGTQVHEALLIFWFPIGSRPEDRELFCVETIGFGDFPRLWVFSVSLYFRRLLQEGIKELELQLPEYSRRASLLATMVRST